MNPFYLVLNPDNTISFNRPLAHAIGLSETILYGALVAKWYYYSERDMLDEDGWFYSTVPDLQESTSLTEKQQKRCIKALVDLKLIKCETKGMPDRRCFHLIDDYQKITNSLKSERAFPKKSSLPLLRKISLKLWRGRNEKTLLEMLKTPSNPEMILLLSAIPMMKNLVRRPSPNNKFRKQAMKILMKTAHKPHGCPVPPKGQTKFRRKVRTSSAKR